MSNFDRLFITAFNKKNGGARAPSTAIAASTATVSTSPQQRASDTTFHAAYGATTVHQEPASAPAPMTRNRARRFRDMLGREADVRNDLPPPLAPTPAEEPHAPSVPPAYAPQESVVNIDSGPQPLHRKRQRLRPELRSTILPMRRANPAALSEANTDRRPQYRLDEPHAVPGQEDTPGQDEIETSSTATTIPQKTERLPSVVEVPERLPPVTETEATPQTEVPERLPAVVNDTVVEDTAVATIPLPISTVTHVPNDAAVLTSEPADIVPATVPLSTLSRHREAANLRQAERLRERTADNGEPSINPRLKVHRFTWPPICQQLAEAAGPELLALGTAVGVRLAARHLAILVAGANPAVGTTIVVLTLAYYLAKQGRRVAVVDADVNNPQLAKQLRVGIPGGWDGFVRGDKPLEEVLVESIADGIALVGLRTKPKEGLSLLESFRFDTALRVLKQRYEVVLVDGASATSGGAATKAVLNSARFDSALLVDKPQDNVPSSTGPQQESHRASLEKLIAKAGIDLLGVVLNRSINKLAK